MFKQAVSFLLIISVNYSLGFVYEASNNVNLECGCDLIIIINEAHWVPPYRSLWTELKDLILPSRKQEYPFHDMTSEVESNCQGKTTCYFIVDKIPPEHETLKIDFDCENPEVLRDYQLQLNENCPNKKFLDKHVNTLYKNTNDGVADFAKQVDRMGLVSSKSLAVFDESAMTYHREGNLCVFNRRASKYDCHKSNEWVCNFVGQRKTKHNLYTGHYSAEWDRTKFDE